MEITLNPVPLQKLFDPFITNSGLNVFILRLDLNHPEVSGNKWYKLKYNLLEAAKENKHTILTFGGAYSNHIAATAAAGKELNFKTIGVIRGEISSADNPTLSFAHKCGMKLHFVDRETYRKKEEPGFIKDLKNKFGDFYLIPEGGHNYLGVKGCREILQNIDIDFDHVCCSCGTGTTLAGIVLSIKKHQQAIGFSSLKGGEFLEENVKKILKEFDKPDQGNWRIEQGYHLGRYAKTTKELEGFIEDFEKHNHIPLEQVYTGKMMFGVYDMIRKGKFIKGETILVIHSGGLQGKKTANK